MNWSSLPEFLEMGGYALYVWGSYVMLLGALTWEATQLVQRRRRARDDVRQYALLARADDIEEDFAPRAAQARARARAAQAAAANGSRSAGA